MIEKREREKEILEKLTMQKWEEKKYKENSRDVKRKSVTFL